MTQIRTEVVDAIRLAIAEKLKDHPIEECGIVADIDSVGDEAIFVDLCYTDVTSDPIDPRQQSELLTLVLERLGAIGEDRFPYLRHHLLSDQKIIGWD